MPKDPGAGELGSWSLRSFNLNLGEKIWEAVGPASTGGGDVVGVFAGGSVGVFAGGSEGNEAPVVGMGSFLEEV